MGSIVRVYCKLRGFDKKTEIGGGMFDFKNHSHSPYLLNRFAV